MKEYIGKQMYGFKFADHEIVIFTSSMDEFIGQIGNVVDARDHALIVKFDSNPHVWWYPVELVEDYIIDNTPPIDLKELFSKIKQL